MYTMYFITVLFAVLIPLIFPFFFWNELSWKLIKNVYLNRGPNKLMLQCPSLLHQMYMLFINWMYFICDNKLCWTWTWTWTWKAPRHWPLCGEFTGTGEFPAQRASYAENVSIWWRHHDCYIHGVHMILLTHWSQDKMAAIFQNENIFIPISLKFVPNGPINSLRPSDAYMRHWTNYHWFR